MFDVATSVLRYWESEFKTLSPSKGRNGVRRYTVEDIEEIEKIHQLLKNRGFTIDGAKKELKQINIAPQTDLKPALIKIKDKLLKLKKRLDEF